MDWLQVVVLSLLQGLTEFLPISSSAHLILPAQILGWEDQGLAFDVAVHLGTLLAVVVYFRKDMFALSHGFFSTGFSRTPNADGRLAWFIILATLPAGLSGLMLKDWIEVNLRSTEVIAYATIGFGLLLALADKLGKEQHDLAKLTLITALVIGFAQALALIPGTSRSGITITAALLVGLNRVDAARFSFLLSIPLIAAAASLLLLKLISDSQAVDVAALVAGVVISALSAWVCIHYFLAFIQRIGMTPFVIYRLLLGVVLFAFFV